MIVEYFPIESWTKKKLFKTNIFVTPSISICFYYREISLPFSSAFVTKKNWLSWIWSRVIDRTHRQHHIFHYFKSTDEGKQKQNKRSELVFHHHYSIKCLFRRGYYFTAYANHFIVHVYDRIKQTFIVERWMGKMTWNKSNSKQESIYDV